MFISRYIIIIVVSMVLLLNACVGGGGYTNGTAKPTQYPAQTLGVTFEAWNNQYSGINESGIKVIDATPFNQRTIISVRLTNNLTYPVFDGHAYPLGGYPVWSNSEYLTKPVIVSNPDIIGERIGRISYFYVYPTDVRFTKIVTPDWCGYYTKQNPLQPNESCVSYISIDWAQNYDTTESIDLPIGYNFKALNPDFPTSMEYGISYSSQYKTDALCKLNPNTCLPILYAPIKVGRWYVNESGYDFAGNTAGVVLANTETDGDYLYLNSSQKIKVNYDANGIAQLDFNTNLTTCVGNYCYLYGGNISYGIAVDHLKGLNTNNYYYKNYFPSGEYYPATQVYRFNYAPTPINELIPNIGELRAVQPDGTLIGSNSAGVYGCFNNDGSNFRPFTQLYGWRVRAGYSWNITVGQSNWIPVQSTNQNQYWKVIADNTGKCELDVVNSFTLDAIMYSQSGFPGRMMMRPQITESGVFAQNFINGRRYLKFYKYPPAQN